MPLTPLGSMLGGWRPRSRGPRDPLGAAAEAWPEVAGPEMGRLTRPVALENRVLTILVPSSTWSQQLAFLADRLIAGLSAAAPSARIERLRFRVGRPAARRSAPVSPPASPNAPATAAPEAEAGDAPDDLVGRLRAHVERRRAAHARAGGGFCDRCSALVQGRLRCEACSAKERDERTNTVTRLMYDAPWLGFTGTAAFVAGLSLSEYESIRARVLARWWGEMRSARYGKPTTRTRQLASSYVLLHTGWEPERITPEVMRTVLGAELEAVLFPRVL